MYDHWVEHIGNLSAFYINVPGNENTTNDPTVSCYCGYWQLSFMSALCPCSTNVYEYCTEEGGRSQKVEILTILAMFSNRSLLSTSIGSVSMFSPSVKSSSVQANMR